MTGASARLATARRAGAGSREEERVGVEVLVTYDVSTETAAGRRRLRRVANVCIGYGQRVQKSVFECLVTEAQLEQLVDRLAGEIDDREDSLRVYRLREPRNRFVQILGRRPQPDLRDPLII